MYKQAPLIVVYKMIIHGIIHELPTGSSKLTYVDENEVLFQRLLCGSTGNKAKLMSSDVIFFEEDHNMNQVSAESSLRNYLFNLPIGIMKSVSRCPVMASIIKDGDSLKLSFSVDQTSE